MTEGSTDSTAQRAEENEISLFTLGTVLLRWRRTIVGLALLGAAIGLTRAIISARQFTASATFIPQGTEQSSSGLALAASQFGVRVPSSGGSWTPPMYVELIRSRALLEPITFDTVVVAEQNGRRFALMDLLGISGPNSAQRIDRAFHTLQGMVKSSEVKELNAVKLSATTRWPSVSLALAERLVSGVNQFNVETRKSQAVAERQFVEAQAVEADRALREAEDRLQSFLQGNRQIEGSPQLAFERDRLQRAVTLRQELQTSWLKSREEARIREVRDIPVITVFEPPRLPIGGESRGAIQKFVLGGIAGGLLGIFVALIAHALAGARRTPSEDAREFFRLVGEATPRFLRRHEA